MNCLLEDVILFFLGAFLVLFLLSIFNGFYHVWVNFLVIPNLYFGMEYYFFMLAIRLHVASFYFFLFISFTKEILKSMPEFCFRRAVSGYRQIAFLK